jgi:ABC-2 type transport system permease protein
MTLSIPAVRRESRPRSLVDFYLTMIGTSIQSQFQYRAATYMYLLGMVAEPVIYLVVWSTIARTHGGQVAGITAAGFAAYYIAWTLVRNMNIVFTPYGWEWRIREGQLSGQLLRPLHPIHYDIAEFAGSKVIWVLFYIPIAAGLTLIFRPAFSLTPLSTAVFFLAIWGAYLIRTLNHWILGMVTFWTTRGSALFETYINAELLLSGRLVPLQLLPLWVQGVAAWLPFKWTFFFPIEVLVGHLTPAVMLGGLGSQALWIVAYSGGVVLFWRFSVRHYTAVGN